MSKVYESITDLVGKTPLVHLKGFEKKNGLNANVLGKLEYLNPTGSVKDRAALRLILEAEREGKLKPGQTIVDNTSGNTGISLAAFANARGYRYVCFLEPGVTEERTQVLKAYGAELYSFLDIPGFQEVVAKSGLSFVAILDLVQKYADEHGYYYTNQCGNINNPLAHYYTTGPEIWEDTDGKVDYVIQLCGTGGTITGLTKFFKEKNEKIQIVGVQPAHGSRLGEEGVVDTIDGVAAFHGNDVPETLRSPFFKSVAGNYDEVIDISAAASYEAAREVLLNDGVFPGQSAGAALAAAKIIAARPEAAGKNIVVIIPDDGYKYLSTNLYK